jgi:hypothetical protein
VWSHIRPGVRAAAILEICLLLSPLLAVAQSGQASISALIIGGRPDVPITFYIECTTGDKSIPLSPGDPRTVVQRNLSFGTYYVSARQGPNLVTEIEPIQLDSAQPDHKLTLALSENHGAVMVLDPGGRPVRDVTVRTLRLAGGPVGRALGGRTAKCSRGSAQPQLWWRCVP